MLTDHAMRDTEHTRYNGRAQGSMYSTAVPTPPWVPVLRAQALDSTSRRCRTSQVSAGAHAFHELPRGQGYPSVLGKAPHPSYGPLLFRAATVLP